MPIRTTSVLLSLLLSAVPAVAQVLHVDASASPGGNGASWSTAYDGLQAALNHAANDASIVEVWVAAGTYTPVSQSSTFVLQDDLGLFGGFAGTETSRSQRDWEANATILSGDLGGNDAPNFVNYDDNCFRIVSATSVDDSAIVDGFTIRGARGHPTLAGGAVFVIDATPSLSNLLLTENRVVNADNSAGAGVFISGFQHQEHLLPPVVLHSCRFVGNRAAGGAGLFSSAPVVVIDSVFERNASIGGGLGTSGAFLLSGPMESSFEGCIFMDNAGSGIQYEGIAAGSLTLIQCLFEGNEATGGAGVYMVTDGDSELDVFDSVFRDNRGCSGIGIYTFEETRVEDSIFEGNVGAGGCGLGSGGGGLRSEGASVVVVGSSFRDNRRGHLWASSGGSLSVRETSMLNSFSGLPGSTLGMNVFDGSAVLENSIVWGTNPTQIVGDANVTAIRSNVRMNGLGLPGPGNLDQDPLFDSDSANGLRLSGESPCIDAGDPALGSVSRDLEGDPRFLDGDLDGSVVMDMGCDEFTPVRLDVSGNVEPGGTITVDVTGEPGLRAILAIGPPGAFFLNLAGPLFVDLGQSVRLKWGFTPSSTQALIPQTIPPGIYEVQVFAFVPSGGGIGAATLSNTVRLVF